MAQITHRTDSDILFIAVEGRIDASNAAEFEEKAFVYRNEHEGKRTVIDADSLEYISSAGLRVILKLRKADPEIAIINVSPEVYGILEMTGFTDMITVEKAFPRISLEGCEFIAKGANGAVYRYNNETIVKHYYSRDALPEIKQERENARKAFVLGMNTAIPYGIVRIDDGYGSVTELLNAEPLAKMINGTEEEFRQAVAYFADTAKHIHSIEVDKGELPDFREWVVEWADFLKDHLPAPQAEKMYRLINALPESKYMIHGDYHANNLMIQNGEAIIIDLDTLSVGCPILELGSAYNAFAGFSYVDHGNVKRFLGIDYDTAGRFWRASLARYLGTDDEAVITDTENKAKVIGFMRLVRRSIRRNKDADIINRYREALIDALDKVETLDL